MKTAAAQQLRLSGHAPGADASAGTVPAANGRIRAALMWLLALGVIWGVGKAVKPSVIEALDRPVASVQVEGEFRQVDRARVEALVQPLITNSFLRLDLEAIKTGLELEPWIDTAALGRRWPDHLMISIAEQQAIARWGDGGFLNQRGEVVAVEQSGALQDLPLLDAQPGRAAQLLTQYKALSLLLRSRQLVLTELHCDEKGAWSLRLRDAGSNATGVAIGRDQLMARMQRFLKVYDQTLVGTLARVERVDVRYNNGVAVSWLAPEELPEEVPVKVSAEVSGKVSDKTVQTEQWQQLWTTG